MKKIFLLLGLSLSCCVHLFCQVNEQEIGDPTAVNDEISVVPSIEGDKNMLPLLPLRITGIGGFQIISAKTGHKSGHYFGTVIEGDTLLSVAYRRNNLQGLWISKFTNKTLCDSGKFDRNLPDGVWKSWYRNGNIKTIRTYSASKLRILKNDLLRYNQKTNMNVLAAIIRNRPGSFTYYTTAARSFGSFIEKDFANRFEGMSAFEKAALNISSKADQYLPPFTSCFHEGLSMTFYPSGETRDSGYYQNGLRTGMWIEKFGDGNVISRGAYNNDLKYKTWSFYNRENKLLLLKTYGKKGEEISCKRF